MTSEASLCDSSRKSWSDRQNARAPGLPRSAGRRYLADDNVGFEETAAGEYVAHSLYGGARLWPADGAFFPEWSERALHPDSGGDEPKLLLYVGRRHGERLVSRAAIAAIAFPIITPRPETRLRRLGRAETFRELVTRTLFLLMMPEPADIEQMLRLASRLRAASGSVVPSGACASIRRQKTAATRHERNRIL